MANTQEKKKNWLIRLLQWLFPCKGDSAFEVIRKLIFLVAMVVLIGSAAYIGNYFWQRYQSSQVAAEISDIYAGNTQIDDANHIPLPDGYNPKFDSLYQINQDIKGWITVPGTTVNYPVLQASDNDYYLHRNIYRNYDINGVPFLDYRNVIENGEQSDNMVIYGHHMNFDGVFGVLEHYNDLDFYKEHPTITFDSVYQDMQWKVVAGFYAATTEQDEGGPVFDYQNYIDLSDRARYDEFVNQITSRSVVDTGVDVRYGDHFLTLSTCTNEFSDGRFVIVARQVRDGEDAGVDVSAATYNPNPVYPAVWHP